MKGKSHIYRLMVFVGITYGCISPPDDFPSVPSIGFNNVEYIGVLSRQWNQHTRRFQVTFSALSASGVSLWGIRTGD